MKFRAALLAGLTAVGTLAASSSAAGPSCFLIEDAKGDTFLLRNQDTAGGPYGPQEDAMDLVTMDIATDAKNIGVAIRIAALSKTASTSPYGQAYEFQFTLPGSENVLYLGASTDVEVGDSFSVGYRDPVANLSASLGEAKGKFDLAKNEIFISAPLSVFSTQGGIKPGTKLSGFNITGSRNIVVANVFADVAVSDKSYTAGTATCVDPSAKV